MAPDDLNPTLGAESAAGQVDRLCDEFEAAWQAGRNPAIEEYLSRVPDQSAERLLHELLWLEVSYLRRAGKVPVEQDYRRRFPGREELVAAVFSRPEPASPAAGVSDETLPDAGDDSSAPRPAAADSTGGGQSRFRIVRPHAKGGLGEVFVARDEDLKRDVALKQIQPHRADDRDSRARFLLEAQVTGTLEHPGIVPVYALGRHADGRPYYAMRLIKGESLKTAIERFHAPGASRAEAGRRTLELHKLLRRFIDVCNAIEYAHSRGVLHRDLKPANIMLGEYGETLVVDWGLAKVLRQPDADANAATGPELGGLVDSVLATQAGSTMGTPQYMSPEQAAGNVNQLGPASDVYSLGATLYTLLTGQAPFKGSDINILAEQVRDGEFPRPRQVNSQVPASLEALCLKAMDLRPQDRYPSARALADDVEHWLADEPVSALPEALGDKVARFARRHHNWVRAAVAALVLLTAVSVGAALLVNAARHEEARQRAAAVALASQNKRLAHMERAAKDDAQTRRKQADAQRNLAERRLHVATAWRLAAQSQRVQRDNPVQSLLLATEAIDATRRYNEPVIPVADETLHNALTWVGGTGLFGQDISTMAFSPDGRWLATASDKQKVRLWDLTSSDPSARSRVLRGFEGYPLAITPDSRWLLTANHREGTRLSDLTRTNWSRKLSESIGQFGIDMVISLDSRWLALAESNVARLWDLTTSDPTKGGMLLQGAGDCISRLDISPGSRWLVSTTEKGAVHLWELTGENSNETVKVLHGNDDPVRSLAISPDGHWLISTAQNGALRLWDLTSAEPAAKPQIASSSANPISKVVISPDSHWLLTDSTSIEDSESEDSTHGMLDFGNAVRKDVTRLWDLTARDPSASSRMLVIQESLHHAAFSPNGRWLATVTPAAVNLFDLESARPLDSLILHPPSNDIRQLEFSLDSRWLVAACEEVKVASKQGAAGVDNVTVTMHGFGDDTIQLWDFSRVARPRIAYDAGAYVPDSRVEPESLRLPSEGRFGFYVSPNSRWLVTRVDEKNVRLFDLGAKEPDKSFSVLRAHAQAIIAIHFSPNSRWLATGSEDASVRLWDLTASDTAAGTRIWHTTDEFISAKQLSCDGRWLLTDTNHPSLGSGSLWDLAATASHEAPRSLSLEIFSNPRISSDGRWLVDTIDQTSGLWLWDTAGSTAPMFLRAPRGWIDTAVGLSPDARWLVTSNEDGTLWYWDLKARDVPSSAQMLPGSDHGRWPMAISADGQWLVRSSEDNSARLWRLSGDGPTAEPAVLRGHAGPIEAIVISADSRLLVTIGSDATARIWNLTASDPSTDPKVIPGDSGFFSGIVSAAISPDGRCVVLGTGDGTARLWDLTGTEPVAKHALLRGERERDRVLQLQEEPSTSELADEDIPLSPPPVPALLDLAISPDSRWLLATNQSDNMGRLCDLLAEDPEAATRDLYADQRGILRLATFSFDSRWAITSFSGSNRTSYDQTVQLWDSRQLDSAGGAKVLGTYEETVIVTPDHRWLITLNSASLRLWDLASSDPSAQPKILLSELFVTSMATSRCGRWLAASVYPDTAYLWDLAAADGNAEPRIVHVDPSSKLLENASIVMIGTDGRWLVVRKTYPSASLWDLNRGNEVDHPIALPGHDQAIYCNAIDPDGRWLVTGSVGGTVRLWELNADGVGADPRRLGGHEAAVVVAAFSPDGRWLATADEDGTARVWDLAQGKPGSQPKVVRKAGGSIDVVAVGVGGHWLLVGSFENRDSPIYSTRLWNLRSSKPLFSGRVLRAHEGPVTCAAFSPDGRWLATGSGDKLIALWDLTEVNRAMAPRLLRGHEHWIESLAFSSDGQRLITASPDTVRVWHTNVDELVRRAKGVAGRELTPDERKQYQIDQ